MQWKLSQEQDDYREALRGWLGETAGPDEVRAWYDAAPGRRAELVGQFERRLAGDGMGGVGVPESLGGQGGGLVELTLTAEELARAGAPSAAWLATALAVPALESRPDLVGAALDGGGAALLIPAERVPAATTTLMTDSEARVSGRVARVLGADRAALLVACVETGDGVALHVLDAGADGVRVTPRDLLDRSRSVADVQLDKVASVPLDVDAAEALARVADRAGVLAAADALGAMQRMLDLAVEYSAQRRQFGVPIGAFQAVKHAAASLLVDVEAGRSGVYFAAASVEAGDARAALHAAAVKAQVTAAAARGADTALTVHGAIGYTWEHDLHRHYKRARLDQALFGAPAAWNERIAAGLQLV